MMFKRFLEALMFAALAVMFTAISGCAKEPALSRSEAREKIAKDVFKSTEEDGEIPYGTVRVDTKSYGKECHDYAARLTKSEWATIQVSESFRNAGFSGQIPVTIFEITPTPALKKLVKTENPKAANGYARASVQAWRSSLGEVTGIVFTNEGKTEAIVEYEVVYEGSPFSGFNGCGAKVPKTPETSTKKAIFRLYDDGWRAAPQRSPF